MVDGCRNNVCSRSLQNRKVYMSNQVFKNVMVIVNVIKNILKRSKIPTIFFCDFLQLS
jgi:hypothetical protein